MNIVSTDHKEVGVLYFVFGIFSGIVGTSLRIIIRVELGHPGVVFSEHIYNAVITSHALVIILFLVMPIIIGGLGNWMFPVLCGLPDIAFPRINALRFWLLPFSLLTIVASIVVEKGVGTG